MNNVMTIRAGVVALLMAPLAACSSLPDASFFIPSLRGGDEVREAPTDGRVSILNFEQGLQKDSSVELGPIVLPPAYINPVWPQPDGYPTHTLQHTQASGNLDVLWTGSFGNGSDNDSRLNARPVVSDGVVYMLDASGELSAVDAETGDLRWSVEFEGPSKRDQMSFGGGLTFDNGRIYAHAGYNYFVALDARTGSEIWRTEMQMPFHGAPTVVADRVFVSSDDNELLSIDADTGVVQWNYQGILENARLLTAPSPAVLGDVIVAPFASGELVALNAQNGNPIWSDSLTRSSTLTAMSEINDIAGSPVIFEGVVYAMSHSGIMVAIDIRSGERLWSVPAGGLHTPWVVGDFLYAVTNESEVICVDRHTGAIHWITQLPNFENEQNHEKRIAWSGPIMASGRVFLASSAGDAVIINAYDGVVMREFDLRDNVFVAPVIANETIYIVTDEARIIALR
jgi:outer membrane protein assembly factor BamB